MLGASATQGQPTEPLTFEHFALDAGLDDYIVYSAARDARGFLWVGTQKGLNRFDGARFHSFSLAVEGEPRAMTAREVVLDTTVPGGVWVATASQGLRRYAPDTRQLSPYTPASHGLASDTVTALLADASGTLWVGTRSAGLSRLRPDANRFDSVSAALAARHVTALALGSAWPDLLWVGTTQGLALLDARTGETLGLSEDRSSLVYRTAISAIAEVAGQIWIATRNGTLFSADPETGRIRQLEHPDMDGRKGAISSLSASSLWPHVLWVGTRRGGVIALDTKTGDVSTYSSTLAHNDVLAVHEDGEGLLWVGTVLGLSKARLVPPRFAPGPSDAMLRERAPAVLTLHEPASDPNVILLSLARDGLHVYDRVTQRRRAADIEGLPNLIFTLHEDGRGHLWIGGRSTSLYRWDRTTNQLDAFSLTEDRPADVRHIYESPRHPGTLWIATSRLGLIEFDAERTQILRRYDSAGDAARALSIDDLWRVHTVPTDRDGLWIATRGGGLNRLDLPTGTVAHWSATDHPTCVPGNDLPAIASTPDGALWLGSTDGGIARFDSTGQTCERFTPAHGLSHVDAVSLLPDPLGRLWIGSSNGLTLFDPEARSFTTFSHEDGLQGDIFTVSAHQLTARGAMLLGGTDGFNQFYPDRIAVDETPPRVAITSLYVDGESYPLQETADGYAPVELAHTQRDIAVEFAALDLRQPGKNRYAVWLEGAEPAWRQLGTQASARYPVAPFGRHTLHVRGTNRDGIWSSEAASLPIIIRPPAWQTWWFWTLASLAVLGVVVAAYQYRIQQLLRVERTRRRIADDLHDDIGSKVSNVALRLDLAGRNPALPDGERSGLADLAQTARTVVDDLRDAVWIVDAGHDDLAAVVTRMEQFADSMTRGRRLRFTRPDDLPPVPLSMDARRHLYLLFKESIHNAVRHAAADTVEVHVAYESTRFQLTVQDDGVGFDLATVRRGRGLETMRRRAEALGGKLNVESAPGTGTTIRFETALG
ncbi:MAG: two-component regulator propeller domain-containing protein [Bacteroidota bacterium]